MGDGQKWHTMDADNVLKELNSSHHGITDGEAGNRLLKHGNNEITEKMKISPFQIFIDQFRNILVIILIIASIISIAIGEFVDGTLIIVIVIANAAFGFVQDYKAEKSIEALKKLSAPSARVLRDGTKEDIQAMYVVPGDILVLEEGDRVAADARLIFEKDLAIDEAALTGESSPATKTTTAIKDCALPDRKNMAYMNTDVVRGKANAVVVATGMRTEIGNIATAVQSIEKDDTPFQKSIDKLGKQLGIIIMIVTAIVFITQYLRQEGTILSIFLIAVSLAVAAIPEGLPAVTTLSLALGVRKMVTKNALVRRLPVVEGLGNVDVICSDKTGTITEGKMNVTDVFASSQYMKADAIDTIHNSMLVKANVLNNNVSLVMKKGKTELTGDPTEKALLEFAMQYCNKDETDNMPRIDEIPFSSERKMMTTMHKEGSRILVISKGAPETILKKCSETYENGHIIHMDQRKRDTLLEKNTEMASRALRVLAFAYKYTTPQEKNHEENLIFLGLVGMIDSPRKEVKDAIKKCKEAGIRVVMITGDNERTAKAIAKDVGIGGNTLTGDELDKIDDDNLKTKIEEINIFARVSPAHKVRILQALKSNGHIVSMTGDGVNDAPAIKAADVGIAMGIKGTDVAKQTSDIILLDDNFATIVGAVEEGRRIFDNVKRFVTYLLGANVAELLVVFIASLFGSTPLLAVHLLWINLLTDGLPAIALGIDPASTDVMKRKPSKKYVIDRNMMATIGTIGTFITAAVLLLYFNAPPEKAQTVAFTGLVVFELVKLQVIRQQHGISIMKNKYVIISIASSILLQLIVLYTPIAVFFKIVPLGLDDWAKILAVVSVSSAAAFLAIRKFR